MKNKTLSGIFLFSLSLLLLSSCRLYNLEKKLDPENREWISKVRYTITSEERKLFLELPSSEMEEFKEEFWKKRDPDPETEENEFKIEYYNRIDYANRHFIGGGRPGYLQDRGRIYILFGPPSQMLRYPGRTPPYEVWLYGAFPVTFVDRYTSGNYELETTNIAVLSEIGSALARQRKSQEKQIAEYQQGKESFDFNVKIEKDTAKEPFLSIELPYKKIWFKEEENLLETTLELSLEVLDSNQDIFWQFQKDYRVSLSEKELQEKMKKSYSIKIPLPLKKGNYSLLLEIINKTGEEKLQKSLTFDFKT
jgi:GWxTD domain-containing protein